MRVLARVLIALRHVLVVAWIAAAAAAVIYLPTISEAEAGAIGALVPDDAAAIAAEKREAELFALPMVTRTVVVDHDSVSLSAGIQLRIAERATRVTLDGLPPVAAALPITSALDHPPFRWDDARTALTYLYFAPDTPALERVDAAESLAGDPPGRYAGVTGSVPARVETAEVILDRLLWVELATGLLVFLAVAIHFRSLGPALVTLSAVVIAYLCATRVVAWGGRELEVSVPREIEPVIVVLVFGVVTDYAIFWLSRMRALLANGEERREAARRTVREFMPITVTAGLAIVAASASLLAATLGFFEAFGPGMAVAVLVALAVSVTLVPALLAIGGRRLFGRRLRDHEEPADAEEQRPYRSRVVRFASRHPIVSAGACLILLGAAASGLWRLELGDPMIVGLPDDAGPHRAYAAATGSFPPGAVSPTVVLIERDGLADARGALARLGDALRGEAGVAGVVGPADRPLPVRAGVLTSREGNAVRYALAFDEDPLGAEAADRLQRLRERMPALLRGAGVGDARVAYAGDTALVAETVERTLDDLAVVGPIALVAVLLVVAVFLRAAAVPLAVVAASALALAAALGLTAHVFQGALGQDGIVYYALFAIAVLLLSLGSDYNIFLVGRIREEARRRPVREAVAVAGARAATPITTAGLILAGSFAMLALVPVAGFQQVAFAMAAGLLLDAFVVRTLLVPALIALLGSHGAKTD